MCRKCQDLAASSGAMQLALIGSLAVALSVCVPVTNSDPAMYNWLWSHPVFELMNSTACQKELADFLRNILRCHGDECSRYASVASGVPTHDLPDDTSGEVDVQRWLAWLGALTYPYSLLVCSEKERQDCRGMLGALIYAVPLNPCAASFLRHSGVLRFSKEGPVMSVKKARWLLHDNKRRLPRWPQCCYNGDLQEPPSSATAVLVAFPVKERPDNYQAITPVILEAFPIAMLADVLKIYTRVRQLHLFWQQLHESQRDRWFGEKGKQLLQDILCGCTVALQLDIVMNLLSQWLPDHLLRDGARAADMLRQGLTEQEMQPADTVLYEVALCKDPGSTLERVSVAVAVSHKPFRLICESPDALVDTSSALHQLPLAAADACVYRSVLLRTITVVKRHWNGRTAHVLSPWRSSIQELLRQHDDVQSRPSGFRIAKLEVTPEMSATAMPMCRQRFLLPVADQYQVYCVFQSFLSILLESPRFAHVFDDWSRQARVIVELYSTSLIKPKVASLALRNRVPAAAAAAAGRGGGGGDGGGVRRAASSPIALSSSQRMDRKTH